MREPLPTGSWIPALLTSIAIPAAAATMHLTGLRALMVGSMICLALGAYLWRPATKSARLQQSSMLLAVAGIAFAGFVLRVAKTYAGPGIWDFLCFFLDGQVVSRGLDPYSPDSYQQVFAALAPATPVSGGFVSEVLEVGFKYPPLFMLVVAPLGHMSFQVGLAVWMLLLVTIPAFVAVVLVMQRLDDRDHPRWAHGALAASIVMLMPATFVTIGSQQTLLAAMCFLLLMARFEREAMGGIFGGLAILLKPPLIIAAIYLAVTGRLRALAACLATLGVLAGFAFFAYGFQPFAAYLNADFVGRVPLFQYAEANNSSLLAVMLRAFGEGDGVHPLARVDYQVGAMLIGFITLLAVARAWLHKRHEWILGLLLACALLVYPGTLSSYGVLLIVPLASLVTASFRRLDRLPIGRARRGALLLAVGGGALYSLQYHSSFASTLIVWGILVGIAVAPAIKTSSAPHLEGSTAE